MKKSYMAPGISFHVLDMEGAPSSQCAFISNHSYDNCPLYNEEWGETLLADKSMCEMYFPDSQDQFCYDVPLGEVKVFSS